MSEYQSLYRVGEILNLKNTNIQIIESTYSTSESKTKYKIKCLRCNDVTWLQERSLKVKTKCTHCSRNKFILSDDNSYWIGYTQKGEKFLFDGDENIIKYIKSFTWRKGNYGYFQNNKGEKLHRIVMQIKDSSVFINHIGGDRIDNRRCNLTISDPLDNSREKKKSQRNNSGIVGLMIRGKGTSWEKYVGNIKLNGLNIYSKYKKKDEALLDLLIMQRHYGFRHNQNMFGLLTNISQQRINEVIDNVERQLKTKHTHKIQSKNKFILSEDARFYWVYDSKGNRFKIDLASKEKVEQGLWYIANYSGKLYVNGGIIMNGRRKTVRLHRYLMDILDVKYKHMHVDHINSDGLDNRLDNLLITDTEGNAKNKIAKGYSTRKDSGNFRAAITIEGEKYSKTFKSKEKAVDWYNKMRKKSMNNRLEFKTKNELDTYLINQNNLKLVF